MNITEAMMTGKPFRHAGMIGAYLFLNGRLYHRDNVSDFDDIEWLFANCNGDEVDDAPFGITTFDLIRLDWENV